VRSAINYLWRKDRIQADRNCAGSLASKRWRRTAIKTSPIHNEIIAYIGGI